MESTNRHNIRVTLAENIKLLRKEKGLSQERLAELAELHRTYVSSVERAERNISINNIEKIANALGVDIRLLFKSMEP